MESPSKELIDKAIAATVSAIEIYNNRIFGTVLKLFAFLLLMDGNFCLRQNGWMKMIT